MKKHKAAHERTQRQNEIEVMPESGGDNMGTRITKLRKLGEQLHSSLGKFLDEALTLAESEHAQLVPHVVALSERTYALLAQIEQAQDELDDRLETNAEEFIKNYVVKPGFREDSAWGGILRTQGSRAPVQVVEPIHVTHES